MALINDKALSQTAMYDNGADILATRFFGTEESREKLIPFLNNSSPWASDIVVLVNESEDNSNVVRWLYDQANHHEWDAQIHVEIQESSETTDRWGEGILPIARAVSFSRERAALLSYLRETEKTGTLTITSVETPITEQDHKKLKKRLEENSNIAVSGAHLAEQQFLEKFRIEEERFVWNEATSPRNTACMYRIEDLPDENRIGKYVGLAKILADAMKPLIEYGPDADIKTVIKILDDVCKRKAFSQHRELVLDFILDFKDNLDINKTREDMERTNSISLIGMEEVLMTSLGSTPFRTNNEGQPIIEAAVTTLDSGPIEYDTSGWSEDRHVRHNKKFPTFNELGELVEYGRETGMFGVAALMATILGDTLYADKEVAFYTNSVDS